MKFTGLAAVELKEAEAKVQAVVSQGSQSQTIWKLYGDIKAAYFHVTSAVPTGSSNRPEAQAENTAQQ